MRHQPHFVPLNAYFALIFCLFSGCAMASTPLATTAPSAGGNFSDAKCGIQVTWPGGWSQQQSKDYDLLLIPDGSSDPSDKWISLDIPELPMHIPGMIPIGPVENGYLDDLRKQFGKIDVKELSPPAIPDSKRRLVRATWQANGMTIEQTALLLVHDDHVYILRAYSDAKNEDSVRPTFDAVANSIQWLKGK
jgi:hypothetical protein